MISKSINFEKKIMFGMNQEALLAMMQKTSAESKERLDEKIVHGEAGGGLIHIEMTGNRALKSLKINAPLQSIDKEDLEDLLSVALSKALEEAEKLHTAEAASTMGQFLPNFM
jgi:DNA-binding YbaB/EbfC family protein